MIDRCRTVGLEVTVQRQSELLGDLRKQYEMVLRAAHEREEQARIKAQIREEQILERERRDNEKELQRLERERTAYQAALDSAISAAQDEHSTEIERLKEQLAQVEAERTKRTISQAELTKSGHVYVISNIGSFGDGVYKVGMTRRLEPHERVRELGDASVPFPFDVHMMISCNDAPTLENALHRALHKRRINKVNLRKEFFKVDIQAILDVVREHHGEVDHLADAEAIEFRQSLTISDEDADYIESVYDELEDDGLATSSDV